MQVPTSVLPFASAPVLLAGLAGAGEDPAAVAAPLEPRLAARETLASALREARSEEVRGLETLLTGAREAREQLAASRLATVLDQHAQDARWIGMIDEDEARDRLVKDLTRVVGDLSFERRDEAPLPAGFPAPTPVGEIEGKEYPRYRMAHTAMDEGNNASPFWRLFLHIQQGGISMTSPVQVDWTDGDEDLREANMAFLYGDPALGAVATGTPVEVSDVEAAQVVSLGCRGLQTPARVEAARAELVRWITDRPELEVAGDLRTMSYNSPMVPARQRYYEVQIPVRTVDPRDAAQPARGRTVVNFSDPDEVARWRAVDDVVMGGVSRSRLELQDDGGAAFTGDLSLDNNGGFASVRSRTQEWGLDNDQVLTLRFRGDGQTYKFRLHTSRAFDGVSYQAVFETRADEWMEVSLTPRDFRAVWRGRDVPQAPKLRFDRVASLGFLISDKQEGEFRLELLSITASDVVAQ